MADFQSVKTRTSKKAASQQWFFMFYWRLFCKIHMLILIISIQLEEKRENREPLWTVLATFSLFWPRFADHRRSECAKVPGYMSRHSGGSHKSASFYWANVWRIVAADRLNFEGDMGYFRKKYPADWFRGGKSLQGNTWKKYTVIYRGKNF